MKLFGTAEASTLMLFGVLLTFAFMLFIETLAICIPKNVGNDDLNPRLVDLKINDISVQVIFIINSFYTYYR